MLIDLVKRDELICGVPDVAGFDSELEVFFHAPTAKRDEFSLLFRQFKNLRHSCDVRREHRDERETFRRGKKLVKVLVNVGLRL